MRVILFKSRRGLRSLINVRGLNTISYKYVMNRKSSIVYLFLKGHFFWYDEEIEVFTIELKWRGASHCLVIMADGIYPPEFV